MAKLLFASIVIALLYTSCITAKKHIRPMVKPSSYKNY